MADRLSSAEMAYELAKMIYGKSDWLQRFAGGKNRRGDHEIDLKRRELTVLQQAKTDYERAAGRAA